MRTKIATALFAGALLAALAFASSAAAAEEPCDLVPKSRCFGVASLDAELSTTKAGAHPDLTFSFEMAQDPSTELDALGLRDSYVPTRNVRVELPPGLVGDPNLLGASQQCTAAELADRALGCPNGSQIGILEVGAYKLGGTVLREPIYMMRPPGGDIVARVGFVAAIAPIYIDIKVRSEDDYGLTAEIVDAPTVVNLIRADTTLWGVPADPVHDTERCTPNEILGFNCQVSPPRPPGQSPAPFLTNATRCGVPLQMRVSASSWHDPDDFKTATTSFPPFTECNRVPFGPSLTVEPTNRIAGAPTGLDMTFRLPGPAGINTLEPSQVKDIRIDLPVGMSINPGAADGLATCSVSQVRFGERVNARCPDAAKFGVAEFDVPALPRKMVGAIYIREPIPGNLFRVWLVADDQGAHVKLPAQLEVDEATGQISSVVIDVPQVPVREVKLVMKSGFRAPVLNPPACGAYEASFEFVPWSGNPSVKGKSPFVINGGCNVGGFDPKLRAGTLDPAAGRHSPFLFTLTREDGEQNPAALNVTLPQGLSASFLGVGQCPEAAAASGECPEASRIGRVIAAAGAGSDPLWVPQPGKRPTAVYLGGPYKGAPLSVIAVVPAQAGPFDLGNQVVRSAVFVDSRTAQATVRSDPLPQILQGIPIPYRVLHVAMDRPDFTLNPTGCEAKQIAAAVTSTKGAIANPTAPFAAADCASLGFKPRMKLRLRGGTKRGAHPALSATLTTRPGDANIASAVAAFPPSEFLENAHIRTVCTRAQFASDTCPAGAIYGSTTIWTPILDEPLSGNVYLRSSENLLPDLVLDLRGPARLPVRVEASGRTDSIRGGIRNSFDFVPDAPVTRMVLRMQGGNRGLLVNSRDICKRPYRATVRFAGHNGRRHTIRPRLIADCKKGKKKRKAKRSAHKRRGLAQSAGVR